MQTFIRRAGAVFLCFAGAMLFVAAAGKSADNKAPEKPRRVVIATGRLLDGRGHIVPETRIVVEGSKIVKLDPNASPIDYDLRGLTVMPGWIDSHVHITWSFGPDGKNEGADETTQFA